MSEIPRLRWLCRRGMKELDVLLSDYLESKYERASAREKALFKKTLAMPDPDLYALILGRSQSEDPELGQFVEMLRVQKQSG